MAGGGAPGDAVEANPERRGERRLAHGEAAGDDGAGGGHDEADPTGEVGAKAWTGGGTGAVFTTVFLP